MTLSQRTQAIMLLTVHVASRASDAPEPLDLREWNKLAHWLDRRELTPESLIQQNPYAVLTDIGETGLEFDRLRRLLDRGPALALALDRWMSAGIWAVNRSEPAYPRRLKERLKGSAPVLLFGCGDIGVTARRGVAIVGSRNATMANRQLAHDLGQAVTRAGSIVVSGGAKGIDAWAADGAWEAGGTSIAVVADSLVRNAAKKPYRERLLAGKLVLVTPYSPEAGFSAGNAHGRNRLIYCLADTAIAVCSSNGSGGTWAGAVENLRKHWVPLWVVRSDDAAGSGNPALVAAGACWLPPLRQLVVNDLFTPTQKPAPAADAPVQPAQDMLC